MHCVAGKFTESGERRLKPNNAHPCLRNNVLSARERTRDFLVTQSKKEKALVVGGSDHRAGNRTR